MTYEKAPRSWSQLESYTRCPYAYKLERIDKVWSRPAAWLPMGTAVHKAAEDFERSGRQLTRAEAKQSFTRSYTAETNEYLDETPNPYFWHSSGRYLGPTDIVRRYSVGLEHVDRYIDYTESVPDEVIWIREDGEPAIEMYFELELEDVTVRGYLDQAVETGPDTIKPEDVKSGSTPGKPEQLSIYKAALEQMAPDKTVEPGGFIMTKSGKEVRAKTTHSIEQLTHRFGQLEDDIRNERFDPKPGPDCRRCGVNQSCEFYNPGG